MKLGDRFKVKGGKVHITAEREWFAVCGMALGVYDNTTSAPVSCHHCLRKLDKIKAIALMAGEATNGK